MAITSEQIWSASAATDDASSTDAFVLGEPAHVDTSEPSHLLHDVDWSRAARAATTDFFEGRDPGRPMQRTLAKILGVIVALAAIALVTLGVVGVLALWTFRAAFG